MTDRIVTQEELEMVERSIRTNLEAALRSVQKLIPSHYLLQCRVKELEATIGWYEAKHPND